jgi:hypothetical protein
MFSKNVGKLKKQKRGTYDVGGPKNYLSPPKKILGYGTGKQYRIVEIEKLLLVLSTVVKKIF